MLRIGVPGRVPSRALWLVLFLSLCAGFGPALQAKAKGEGRYAAYVVDVQSGRVLFAKNAGDRRYPASLTKIMTLYLLFEDLEAGRVRLNQPLTVSAHAAAQAPSKLGLKAGSTIQVQEAIKALVTKSANDVAATVAENLAGSEQAFARRMTAKARALGMSSTTFRNASGLPDGGQVSTARDLALLGIAVQQHFPAYYRFFSTRTFRYGRRAYGNHNKLLGRVEGVDGIKTGYTNASGFNLVTSVRRGGRQVVAVVLGGASGRARDLHMQGLIAANLPKASPSRTDPVLVAKAPREAAPRRAVAAATPTPASPAASSPGGAGPARTAVAAAAAPAPAAASSAAISPAGAAPVAAVAASPTPPASAKQAAPATASAASGNPARSRIAAAWDVLPAVQPSLVDMRSGADAAVDEEAPSPPPGAAQKAVPALLASAPQAAEPAPMTLDAQAARLAARTPAAASAYAEQGDAEEPPAPKNARSWIVQIGAVPDEAGAEALLERARSKARRALAAAAPMTERVEKGEAVFYRARFAGLDRPGAEAACKALKKNSFSCFATQN